MGDREEIKDRPEDDVEGHGGFGGGNRKRSLTDEDDVEGHGGFGGGNRKRSLTDEDDVEGHIGGLKKRT